MMQNLVFIDTETGGLDAARDAILTFAAVPVIGGQVVEAHAREWKIRDRDGEVHPKALATNGIDLAKHMAEALFPAEVVCEFNSWSAAWFTPGRWIQTAMHNAPFDTPFVRRLWQLGGASAMDRFAVHQLCTMGHAKMLHVTGVRMFGQVGLEAVARAYGVPFDARQAHGALYDAITGARILVAMHDELQGLKAAHFRETERARLEAPPVAVDPTGGMIPRTAPDLGGGV